MIVRRRQGTGATGLTHRVSGLVRDYVMLDITMTSRLLWILMALVAQCSQAISIKPPRFLQEPQSQVVKHQTEVRLNCHVDPPSATVRWIRDGIYLDVEREKDLRLEGGTLVIGSFRHKPKDDSHVGIYQCEATTPLGTILSRRAALEKAVLGHFEEGLRDEYMNVTEGNVALVTCAPPHGHPAPYTSFEVNNTLIEISSGRYMILPSGNLQIAKSRQSDQGTYQCIATNRVTGQQRRAPNKVHLKVIAPTVNTNPRIVKGPQASVEVMKGDNLTLECVAEGSPVPVVTWEKYGGQLPEGRYTQNLGNLILLKVAARDQGTYICRASTGERQEVYAPTSVDVLEPPMINTPPSDKIVNEGATVSFTCEQQSNPRIRTDTQWLHDGKAVQLDSHKTISETQLTINNAQKSDSGVYQCISQNKLGMTYAAAMLQVRSKGENISHSSIPSTNQMQHIAPDASKPATRPVIALPPHNTTVISGASTAISCTPQTPAPSMEIAWHKDGKPIIPTQTFAQIASSQGTETGGNPQEGNNSGNPQEGAAPVSRYKVASSGSLQIFNVREEDSGQFTCIIAHNGGLATASAFLKVTDPVTDYPDEDDEDLLPELPFGPEGEEGERGRGRKKGKKGRRKNDRDEELEMIPPSRPEVSKLSDTSVMLSWEVPQDEGLPITFFKVQYKDLGLGPGRRGDRGGRRRWHTIDDDIPGSQRRHEVSGLHPGATYKFRVLAVYSNNDNKQSPNSRRFTLNIEGAPGHPQAPFTGPVIVEARAKSDTILSIRWQYLPVDETPIEGFKISYKPFHMNEQFLVATVPFASRRFHDLVNLRPETEYTLKIQSYNNAGLSHFSNEVVRKTLDTASAMSGVPVKSPGGGGMYDSHEKKDGVPPSKDPNGQVEPYEPNPINTQSSSELLYTVLGVVLGVMMLLLVVFMALCWWKQRQQRRMMAELNASMRKFEDPAKAIYVDSIRKKYGGNTGTFLLNNINPTLTNGHGPPPANGHIPNYTDTHPSPTSLNGSKVNISVNPMGDQDLVDSGHPTLDPQDYEDQEPSENSDDHDSQNRQSLDELRTSLQEALPQNHNNKLNFGEIMFGSIDRRSLQRHQNGDPGNPYYTTSSPYPLPTRTKYDPPGYSPLPPPSPVLPHQSAMDQSEPTSGRRLSHENIPLTNMSDDRMPTYQRNKNLQNRALPAIPMENGHGEMPDFGTGTGKNRRKKRRNKEQVVKEMATNTDKNSKDGTLDRLRRHPSSHEAPPPRGLSSASPPLPHTDSANQALLSGTVNAPYSYAPPTKQDSANQALLSGTVNAPYSYAPPPSDFVDDHLPSYDGLLAYTDLPRVHDYPDEDDEDEN